MNYPVREQEVMTFWSVICYIKIVDPSRIIEDPLPEEYLAR